MFQFTGQSQVSTSCADQLAAVLSQGLLAGPAPEPALPIIQYRLVIKKLPILIDAVVDT